MQYNADAQQIETEIHIRVYDTRTHWIFYLKNKIRGKENLDTLFHSIWWKRGGCRILSPREKGCWIPRRSQSKVYECTGGPESSSTTVNTCSAGTILVYMVQEQIVHKQKFTCTQPGGRESKANA